MEVETVCRPETGGRLDAETSPERWSPRVPTAPNVAALSPLSPDNCGGRSLKLQEGIIEVTSTRRG